MNQNKTTPKESAILVGVIRPGEAKWEKDDSLDELALLADTAGAIVTDRMTQVLARLNTATYIGKGKVEELKSLVGQRKTDVVIFDDDLSPIQLRNLERTLKCKLVDRSGLILDIFALRAKTAVAKTQVELAQLDYLRTRLTRQWTHLSRQKGGIGTKGPGEKQIEMDRQMIGHRMAALKQKLARIDRQRTTQRKRRSAFTRVSLAGYTNAGKSTLMNVLAQTRLLAENRLFATLDATTRVIDLAGNKKVLLSDTVGFIRKLPHRLIESFKSTLDEVRESDFVIHLVDVTHPKVEEQIAVVNETLKELGALEKPTMMVFNKVDALKEKGLLARLREEYQDAVFVSALRGIGIQELKMQLLHRIEEHHVERIAYLPVTEPRVISYIHDVADVISESYTYAQRMNGTGAAEAVVRLRFSVAPRYDEDLTPLLKKFDTLEPIEDH